MGRLGQSAGCAVRPVCILGFSEVARRERLRDGGAAPELQGWVHQSELLDLLRCDVSLLHLNIYRLRQQFGEAGIVGAARVVERRAGTRQLRIGVSQLDIRTIEGR